MSILQAVTDLFSYDFLVRALIVGVLISLCAALLGVSLVLKRYSMIGDGLSHVGFGALSFAAVMNWSPLWVAIPVVVLVAFLLLRLNQNSKMQGDAAIALISTTALAFGVLAISLKSGMNIDINSYMFGSILAMTKTDVIWSVILSLIVCVLFLFLYHKLFSVTFDENFARATGIHSERYQALIAALTAVTVVLGMRMMGALLISSLLIFPALTSMRICKNYKGVVILSAVVSVIAFFLGILISYLFDTPTGASVVAINAVFFFFAWIKQRLTS